MQFTKLFAAAVSLLLPLSVSAQDLDHGQEIFQQYCATCHGLDGKGSGPLTELMLEKPGDLTLLSANNETEPGAFPMLRIIHVIDGRTGVRAHGGPMPTYGDIFMSEAADRGRTGSVLETRGRILSLAMYLESIQQ